MSSLPTCWYCPDCGLIDAYDMTGDHEDAEGWCEGVMVTIPAIPPGTPPEQILSSLIGGRRRTRPTRRRSDDPQFEAYAAHVIDSIVPMIAQSECSISLVPSGPTDVKFAVELGMTIMLDKPIILAVMPGTQVPAHLARVADAIVEYDPAQGESVALQLQAAMRRIGLGGAEPEAG